MIKVQDRRLSIRVTYEDLARIERQKIRLQNYLARRACGQYIEVNQRTVVLEGLTQLERFLDSQESEVAHGND